MFSGFWQDQFQVFVGGLRGTYGGKVSTFRHVIQVHQLELQQKQQYWDEALLVKYCMSLLIYVMICFW